MTLELPRGGEWMEAGYVAIDCWQAPLFRVTIRADLSSSRAPWDPTLMTVSPIVVNASTPAAGKAVFLSYASQDAEAARRIAQALRAEGIAGRKLDFEGDRIREGFNPKISHSLVNRRHTVFCLVIARSAATKQSS